MLHGKHFTLRTDHISLLSLQNKNEPARRVQRWLDDLATYDFTLEYLAGPKNVVADAISRAVYTITPKHPDLSTQKAGNLTTNQTHYVVLS